MNRRLSILAAAAAVALLAHVPAHAAASSSASLSDLTITLYDLNPLDGIGPSITFAGLSYSYAYAQTPLLGGINGGNNYGTSAFDANTNSASVGQSNASASSTGGNQTTYSGALSTVVGSLNANGQASEGVPGSSVASYNAQSYWNGGNSNAFTVSANTLVVFSAKGSTSAASTHAYTGIPYDYEYGQGVVNLAVYGPSSSGTGNQQSSDSLQSYVTGTSIFNGSQYVPSSDSKIGNLGVSFLNVTNGNMTGTFYASAYADGYTYAAAVPEPETYALMLAGLGALGFMGRRRKGAGIA